MEWREDDYNYGLDMAEKIKYHSTKISPTQTIAEIEEELLKVGAFRFIKDYEGRKVKAVNFVMDVPGAGVTSFRLPANVESCYKVLLSEVKRPNEGTEDRIRSQAERQAWRIVLDWVQAQVIMVQLKQVEAAQVFFPYAWDPKEEKTVWQLISEGRYGKTALPPKK